jgi:hypothetical protein
MKKKKVFTVIIITVILVIFSGQYVKRKIAEDETRKEQLLIQILNQGAERYLNDFIFAIENGDYMKIAEMTTGNSENYKDYEGIRMKFLDRYTSREIMRSSDSSIKYILKFQGIDTKKPDEKQKFCFVNGFYYTTVNLSIEKGIWHVSNIFSGEYFN